MRTRRHFLAGIGGAAASLWIQPVKAAPDPRKDTIIGHGGFRYRVHKDWVPPGQGRHHPILNCHEMVQVRDGRLFMIGDHGTHQMLVFKTDGTILDSCKNPGTDHTAATEGMGSRIWGQTTRLRLWAWGDRPRRCRAGSVPRPP